jgi:lipopolysaccharide transport system ATP-binding protein
MPIIQADQVTKEYRLGAMRGLKQTLLDSAARLTGRTVAAPPLFKALDDVSFSIEPGEVVGIIGHNGAGKSTLLKLLAKISTPNRGRIKVEGRIAPLIEVGAGFVPEFTGRENVYLNGAILGMSRVELDKKFDEIVDFAEMAKFIDTPVKRYSSGMQVKLAFAVATSIDAEILIVDEVLAVGDLAFQRKCFDRMEDMIKRQGKTVMLVSHNLRHVERISDRVILLDHGRILQDGNPKEVCNHAYRLNDEKILFEKTRASTSRQRQNSSGEVDLIDVQLENITGEIIDYVECGAEFVVRFIFRLNQALSTPIFLVGIHTTDFIYLGATRSSGQVPEGIYAAGIYEVQCQVNEFPFLPGVYALRVAVFAGELFSMTFNAENLHPFQVVKKPEVQNDENREGLVALDVSWDLKMK